MKPDTRPAAWDVLDDPALDPETRPNLVENTTATVAQNALAVLTLGTEVGIEASEKRGQRQFVASDILPAQIRDPWVDGKIPVGLGRRILKAWGFTFGKPVDGDPMFQQARLPPGWSKKGSSHDMWSYILDDKGRERCSIFYKAAFYDRDAFLNVSPRFLCSVEYEDDKLSWKGRSRGLVKDGETVLFTGEWRQNVKRPELTSDESRADAKKWFDANLPEGIVEQWERP